MPDPEQASAAEFMRLFHYIMGQDQAVARTEIRRQTADARDRSSDTIVQSRKLLDRLKAEREADAKAGGVPPK